MTELNNWNNDVLSRTDTATSELRTRYQMNYAEYQRLKDRYERELNKGITLDSKKTPTGGRGVAAIKYENEMQDYYYKNVVRDELIIRDIEKARQDLMEAFKGLTGVTEYADQSSINGYAKSIAELVKVTCTHCALERTAVKDKPSGDDIDKYCRILRINEYNKGEKANINLMKFNDIQQIKDALLLYASNMPISVRDNLHNLISQIDTLGKFGGSDVHPFVLCVGELRNLNLLAIGSLIMALVIDILILFCGILAGKADSFLKLKHYDDLQEYMEAAVEVILSVDINRTVASSSPYVNRIIEILRIAKPDIDLAKEGHPAVIYVDDIKDLKLTQELGVFISLNLAVKSFAGDKIALSTRLILWMADQIVNADIKEARFSEFTETFMKGADLWKKSNE